MTQFWQIWMAENAVMKLAIIAALAQIIVGQGLLILAQRGWPARLVVGGWALMILIGVVSLAIGAATLLNAQPNEVIVVFLAIGIAYACVFTALIPRLRKKLQFAEINRAYAKDL